MKFLKISILLSAYIILWSLNAFIFPSPQTSPHPPLIATSVTTQLIPMMMVDGEITKIQDIPLMSDLISKQ